MRQLDGTHWIAVAVVVALLILLATAALIFLGPLVTIHAVHITIPL